MMYDEYKNIKEAESLISDQNDETLLGLYNQKKIKKEKKKEEEEKLMKLLEDFKPYNIDDEQLTYDQFVSNLEEEEREEKHKQQIRLEKQKEIERELLDKDIENIVIPSNMVDTQITILSDQNREIKVIETQVNVLDNNQKNNEETESSDTSDSEKYHTPEEFSE